MALDREALATSADWLVVAVAASLPWSTTATGIFIALWLVAVLPGLRFAVVRREIFTAAGGLPDLLWVLAAVGMAWADVSWTERFEGLDGFDRLLMIPLLLAQFRRSARGTWVLRAYLASATVLLVASFALALFPDLPWEQRTYGVPVKDYITQSEQFLICTIVLMAFALAHVRAGRWAAAVPPLALAILFFVDILFVATGRTTLLVIPILGLLLAWREWGWRGVLATVPAAAIVAPLVWFGSANVREHVDTSIHDLQVYLTAEDATSTAQHIEFIRKSISFVATAPLIGHGTGSIPEQFRESAVGRTGAAAVRSVNPHDQILAVAIQLGLLGAVVLLAMWGAHLLLFRGAGAVAWIGLVIVVQNIVACLFNSHLFDFTEGWLYVFGVGVAGGMVLRERDAAQAPAALERSGDS